MTVFHLSAFSLIYLIDISESLSGELLQEFSSHFLFPKQKKERLSFVSKTEVVKANTEITDLL